MNLEQALEQFPRFVWAQLIGLLKSFLTETEVFALFVFAALLGVVTQPLIGVAAGVGFYLALRMISQIAALFASKADLLAKVIHDSNQIPEPPVWSPEEDGSRRQVQPERHPGVRDELRVDRGQSPEGP